MFEQLELRNFRSIKNSGTLRLAPLNVLIGPNNAGKSSVLYALLLLKQTMQDKNPDSVLVTSLPGLDLGGYLDLVTNRNAHSSIGMSLQLREDAVSGSAKGRQFSFGLRFNSRTNQISVAEALVRDAKGSTVLGIKRSDRKVETAGIPVKTRRHVGVGLVHFVPTSTPIGKGPRGAGSLYRAFEVLSRHGAYPLALQTALERLLYISPLRARTPPFAVAGTQAPSEMSPTGADLIRLLASDETIGDTGRTLLQLVAETLRQQFGLLEGMSLRRIGARFMELLADEPRGGAKGINVAYTGVGIGQLLPIVAQSWLLRASGCLLVEQPEVHLHPAAQADLADLFLSRLQEHRQFIIETHSEHLVLRLRRRIAEGHPAGDIRLFYFSKKGKETVIQPLDIEADGMVQGWPPGFFEDGYGEALAMTQAALRKGRE